jgi:hypothetical protein
MTIHPLPFALEEGCKPPQCLADIDMDILSYTATSESPDGSCSDSLSGQADRRHRSESKTAWYYRILPIKGDLSSTVRSSQSDTIQNFI